ncbi:PREDICTED: transcription initiation factor TFIID subunit 5-like [Acropora digitifera]|uniref:transcription initiation factor TFIID subunit 5-like n=1 Tax=Acropora digitifera TaxID=70779 RepID=UPI00077A6EF9|nr:PREDICTED: transcription initiation factor TFIID subunit 5-like [Acropora digitifera]
MAANAGATSKSNPSKKEKETLLAVLQFLKKNKLPETEKILRQEANCLDSLEELNLQTTPDSEPDISSVLSAYNSDADPTRYEDYFKYRSNKFVIRMSKDTYQVLKKHLQDQQQELLLSLIQQHLHFDVFEGRPRNKQTIEATAGAVTGEATFEANKSKVYYGIPPEPDLGVVIEDESEDDEDKDKPKKKKVKKDSNGPGKKKQEHNPNAPPLNRQLPFPVMKDSDKLVKITLIREAGKRVRLGPDLLPSICFYSILNAHTSLNTVSISEDSSLLSGGFEDSCVRVWSLTPKKLRMLKPPSELAQIDKEAEDVLERIMDHRFVSYSSENLLLEFSLVSPKGHYFATASHDRTARLWSTDHPQPLRIFAGHVSDVNRVAFHPNCNYVATGSCDRTVRLWDLNTGSSVRFFTGHKGAIYSLSFSPDGRYLASSGVDKRILVWDLAEGTLLTELKGHSDTVYSLRFSRDGNMLASGGVDNCVKLWDARAICNPDDDDLERDNDNPASSKCVTYELGSYPTKRTPVHSLHFTLRNLLLASGPFTPAS